jgi:hypothetical protein
MPDINKLVEQIYAGFKRYVCIHKTISNTLLESRIRGVLFTFLPLKVYDRWGLAVCGPHYVCKLLIITQGSGKARISAKIVSISNFYLVK